MSLTDEEKAFLVKIGQIEAEPTKEVKLKPTDKENGGLNPGEMVVDEFLSGYYVIGGFKYLYKAGATSVKQELNLLRREWPSRVNNINPETVAPATTPPPAPTPFLPPATRGPGACAVLRQHHRPHGGQRRADGAAVRTPGRGAR